MGDRRVKVERSFSSIPSVGIVFKMGTEFKSLIQDKKKNISVSTVYYTFMIFS